jgi:hypothetical protein
VTGKYARLAFMSAPSPSQWYRLTNAYTGADVSLDVVNDNGTASSGTLQMSPSSNASGQCWQLTPYPSASSGTYSLSTLFLGPNKCLDVYINNVTHLANAVYDSGQIWTISPWGDGTWQLSNQYTGSGMYLDGFSDTDAPLLDGGNHSGQHWTFTALQNSSSSPNDK